MSLPDPNARTSVPPPGAPAAQHTSSPVVGGAPAPGSGPNDLRRRGLLGLGVVAVVLVGVLLLSLRGGDSPTGSPLSPIAAAAERTAASPGARVAGTGEVTGAGASMTMSFSGAFSGTGEQATMTYEVQSSSLPAAAAQIGPMEQILDGTTMYMSSPAFAAGLGGKTWMKMDLGEFLPEMESGSTMDARAMLEQLGATGPNPQLVGRERVRGAKTERYTTTIDPRLQAEQLREAGEDEAAELVEEQSTPTTVDVWIGKDDLIRRMATTVGFDLVAGAGSQMQMTIDFFDFGTEPVIEIPSDDEVFDATELGEQALEQIYDGS